MWATKHERHNCLLACTKSFLLLQKKVAVQKIKMLLLFANYDMKLLWKQDLWPNVPHKFTKAKLISKKDDLFGSSPFPCGSLKKNTTRRDKQQALHLIKNCIGSK
jgi:hypothetical protein